MEYKSTEKIKKAGSAPQPMAPPPPRTPFNALNLQMPDLLQETLHAFEENNIQKKDEHRNRLDNLMKSVVRNDASLKAQRRNQTELADECNMLRVRCDDEVAAQRVTQENVAHARVVNKLLKSHCRANRTATQEFKRIVPRVEQYVASAEQLIMDATTKEARDQLEHQQAVAELRQRLAVLVETRDSYNNWHAGIDASSVGERIAKVDMMYDEIAKIKEDNARMEQEIEFYMENNKKKARVVQQKKELEEKRAAYAKDITTETSIIKDQGERMKGQQCMLETLRETLTTEQIMTKEAGEESSKLQEKLFTLECTNATESTALLELRQRSEGMQNELEAKMQILKEKQADESSQTEKVKVLEEMKSTKYWQKNSAQIAWESEKESMRNALSALKEEKEKMDVLLKEVELQRSKMHELIEKQERDEKSWESEVAQLTETLKAKDQEESEFKEKISNLKLKLEMQITANKNKMHEDNNSMTADIDTKKRGIHAIEEKFKIVKQKKENSIELELKLSEEVSVWKEDVAILSEVKNSKDSMQKKTEESWAREEAALSAEIERKEKEAESMKKPIEQLALEIESATLRYDNRRNIEIEDKMLKSQIATCKERQQTNPKLLSTLMSDNQASTRTSADWDTKLAAHRNQIEILQRQLKALRNSNVVKKTEEIRTPSLNADERNSHRRSSLAASSARFPAQGSYERSKSAPVEARRRHAQPVQPAESHNKPESEFEYDFSDF